MNISPDVLAWAILGIALLASEVFTGTFHLMFFGLAALAVAAFAWMGLSPVYVQMIVFAVLAVAGVFFLRTRMKSQSKGFESDQGTHFVVTNDLVAGGEAIIQYQGTPWTALNISSRPLLKGDLARIVRTDGIKLIIEPVQESVS